MGLGYVSFSVVRDNNDGHSYEDKDVKGGAAGLGKSDNQKALSLGTRASVLL